MKSEGGGRNNCSRIWISTRRQAGCCKIDMLHTRPSGSRPISLGVIGKVLCLAEEKQQRCVDALTRKPVFLHHPLRKRHVLETVQYPLPIFAWLITQSTWQRGQRPGCMSVQPGITPTRVEGPASAPVRHGGRSRKHAPCGMESHRKRLRQTTYSGAGRPPATRQ